MKYVAETTFLLLGTIVGSGFVSGREIVAFFGGNILFLSLFAGALFFLTTWLLLSVGGRYGSLERGNAALFGKAEKTVNAAVFFCLFAVSAASLAIVDATLSFAGIDERIPAASLPTLIFAALAARRGIDGVKKLNAFLVPVMLALTLALLFGRGKFSFGAPVCVTAKGSLGVAFYVGFNMFLSASVVARAGGGGKREALLVSALTGAVSALLIALIWGAVNYEGKNAADAALPLAYVFSASPAASVVFGVVLYAGAFTTAVCSYYPLADFAERRYGGKGAFVMAAAVFAFSRFGVKWIVDYVYPAAGVLGALYFVALFAAAAYKNGKTGNIKSKKKRKVHRYGKEEKTGGETLRRGL